MFDLLALRSRAVVAATLVLSLASASQAGESKSAAKVDTVAGFLLQRTAKGEFQPLKAGDALKNGASVVAIPRAEILSGDGAVKLTLLADVGRRGPFPVVEAAVTVNQAAGADLELTLDRGLLSVTNVKKEGAAKVKVNVAGEPWMLTLEEPGTRVFLEIYSRYPPGTQAADKGKIGEPITSVALLVYQGQCFFDTGKQGVALQAPPGRAVVHWDSLTKEPEVQRLEKMPANFGPLTEAEKGLIQKCAAAAQKLNVKDLPSAVHKLLASDDAVDRQVAVTAAGAVNDLPDLLVALHDAKHADVRDHAVLALRHWLGRGPTQVDQFYGHLTGPLKKTPVQARSALHLLFGFDDRERAEPQTYELLIEYLNHHNIAVRELARWHLVRLAPAGKDIVYDAAAPEADRQRAVASWQELIPPGRLPPPVAPAKRGGS